jgi:periplasmic copper chaperone A
VSNRLILTLAAVGATALAAPAAAQAHLTVSPSSAPAGADSEELIRVPNESETASTIKVDVQLPPGFVSASYEAQPGWKVRVVRQKLAKPVQTDDGPVSEEVRRITWTGDGSAQGRIAPGQFMDFPLAVTIPGKAGDTLTFKALQTYSDGKVVRWIGPAGSDEPAPQLAVTAAAKEGAATGAPAPAKPAAASGSSSGSDTLAVVALIVGVLGLLAGGAALLATRRRATTAV